MSSGTCQKCSTKCHDWVDAPQCTLVDLFSGCSVTERGHISIACCNFIVQQQDLIEKSTPGTMPEAAAATTRPTPTTSTRTNTIVSSPNKWDSWDWRGSSWSRSSSSRGRRSPPSWVTPSCCHARSPTSVSRLCTALFCHSVSMFCYGCRLKLRGSAWAVGSCNSGPPVGRISKIIIFKTLWMSG